MPHFLFFQLHQAAEAALGGSVSAQEFLENPFPLSSLYTPQLNMRTLQSLFQLESSGVWNMGKDLVGEEESKRAI